MLKTFEIFRITFKKVEGQIVKDFTGIIEKKDYEDIEKGLATVIEYVTLQKQLPPTTCMGACDPTSLFTIIFKKDAMNTYRVETLAAQVELQDIENILSGLMFMQVKLHMEKMKVKEIKFTLKHDESIGLIDFSSDEQLA